MTASARRTTSSATGSRQASRRSASRSPASRPRAAAGRAAPGPRRPAPRCCARSASGRRGSPRTARGGSPRPSRSRWPTRPRRSAGLPVGAVRLKWPNDLVIETGGPKALLVGELSAEGAAARLAAPLALRKLAGVLGESQGLGSDDPRVVVGIGINGDWARGRLPARARRHDDEPARGLRRPPDRRDRAARRLHGAGRGPDRGAARRRVRRRRAGPSARRRPAGS